jgi:hypothetical protein
MGHGAWGMGHGTWGMGHGALGIGHWAWGMGHGARYLSFLASGWERHLSAPPTFKGKAG